MVVPSKDGHSQVKRSKELKSYEPRIAKSGDAAASTTFTAVGKALSSWTQYELNLARLFAAVLASSSNATVIPPMLAFGAVRTFEGRSAMLRTAGDWFFDVNKPIEPTTDAAKYHLERIVVLENSFIQLMKAGDQFVGRRNEIAHGIVAPFKVTVRAKRHRFALQPAYIEAKKHLSYMNPVFAYGSREILHYTAQFDLLAREAATLVLRIRELLRELRRATL